MLGWNFDFSSNINSFSMKDRKRRVLLSAALLNCMSPRASVRLSPLFQALLFSDELQLQTWRTLQSLWLSPQHPSSHCLVFSPGSSLEWPHLKCTLFHSLEKYNLFSWLLLKFCHGSKYPLPFFSTNTHITTYMYNYKILLKDEESFGKWGHKHCFSFR